MNNTKQITKNFFLFFAFLILILNSAIAQNSPQFTSDPKPANKQWVKVNALSDEFNDASFDTDKWQNTNDALWVGRPPGRFKAYTVTEADNFLRITNSILATPETRVTNSGETQTFTHAGGMVLSKNAGQVGYYYETSMRANKTFMSSTFWLISQLNELSGCDKRTTELDVQETVGIHTGAPGSFGASFPSSVHSNTHSRNVSCTTTPTGSMGANAAIGENAWEGFHTYGVWWRTPTDLRFYLDGKFIYSIVPKADFSVPMYLRFVNETYNWNPVPNDGSQGMGGTWNERTTFYDWVRVWKLEDVATTSEQFFIVNRAANKRIRTSGSVDFTEVEMVFNTAAGNPTKWISIDAGGGYFYLQNVNNGKFIRPISDSVAAAGAANGSRIVQVPNTYRGNFTQWRKVTSSNGYFYLQNRATGMYFRPQTTSEFSKVEQRPNTWGGDFTQWQFIDTNTGLATVANNETRELLDDASFGVVEKSIQINPNPVVGGDLLHVSLGSNAGIAQLQVVSANGSVVKSKAIDSSKFVLETSDLNSGLYFIRIQTTDEIITRKLLVR